MLSLLRCQCWRLRLFDVNCDVIQDDVERLNIFILRLFCEAIPLDGAIYTICGVASYTNTSHFSSLHYLHALVCIVNSDALIRSLERFPFPPLICDAFDGLVASRRVPRLSLIAV